MARKRKSKLLSIALLGAAAYFLFFRKKPAADTVTTGSEKPLPRTSESAVDFPRENDQVQVRKTAVAGQL